MYAALPETKVSGIMRIFPEDYTVLFIGFPLSPKQMTLNDPEWIFSVRDNDHFADD